MAFQGVITCLHFWAIPRRFWLGVLFFLNLSYHIPVSLYVPIHVHVQLLYKEEEKCGDECQGLKEIIYIDTTLKYLK